MTRNVGLVLVVVAAVAAVAWLLAGPAGLFGTDAGKDVGGAGTEAPREAGAPEAAPPESAGAGSTTLLASRRPERRGVGSLAARVVDVKEAALAGASVRVTGTGHGGETVALSAASDAEGRVLFASVAAGVGYVVRVEAPGLPAVAVPDVEVRAGRRTDLSAVQVGARAALAGQVVDEKGVAVAGADVRAFSSHENALEMLGNMMEMFVSLAREPTPLAKATTDSDGRFRLADLPPGPVLVRATTAKRRAGFAKARMAADGPAEGPVTIRLEPGSVVGGVVVEASGTPVPGALVAILSTGGDGETGTDDLEEVFDFFSRRVFAVTDAKGAFTARVREGAKQMRAAVEVAGFPTTMSREFAAGDADVRIVLARGAVLEVTTVDASSGKPVAGAQVVAMVGEGQGMGAQESGGGILCGATDERGVVALPTGPGKVEMAFVSHPGYASVMASPAQKEAMRAMGNEVADDGVALPKEVKPGETARATVRLKAGVRLVGSVTDAENAPLAGVEVKPVAFMGAGGGSPTRTDAAGAYVLEGLSGMMGQAVAMVSFRAPGYVSASETIQLTPEVLAAGEVRHDVELRRAATLRGRVLDEQGKPVAGARVRHTGISGGFDLASLLGSGGVVTDADGAWVLTEVPPSGGADQDEGAERTDGSGATARLSGMRELRVAVTAEGFVPGRSAALRVREGEQVDVPPIRLSRGAVARGVVRLPGGRPAAGARVEARLEPEAGPADMAEVLQSAMSAGRLARTVRADAEGRFEVSGLAPGTLSLVARLDGSAPSRRKAKVGTEPLEVEVFLRPAADLAGSVHGADGRPLAGAGVAVEGGLVGVEGDEGYVEPVTARTDGDGRFTLPALPMGSVTLAVRAKGHQTAKVTATPGGAPLDVRLEVRTGARSREAIQKEVQEVSQRFAEVKDPDERRALQQRLVELMQEMQEEGGEPTDVVVPEGPEAPSR